MTTYYWVGGGPDTNADDGLNWSTTPGGTGTAGDYPGSGNSTDDIAIFQTLSSAYTVTFSNQTGFSPASVQIGGSLSAPITFQFNDGISLNGTSITFDTGSVLTMDTAGNVTFDSLFGPSAANSKLTVDVGITAASTLSNISVVTASGGGFLVLEAGADGLYANDQGAWAVGPSSRLEIAAALPLNQAVAFVDPAGATTGGIVQIDSTGSVAGPIVGFQTGDEIYLPNLTYASTDTYTYDASNPAYDYRPTLTISDGTNSATISLVGGAYASGDGTFGNNTNSNLTFSAGGGGTGVDIFTSVQQPTWKATGTSADWDTGSSWSTGSKPTGSQTAMITGNGGSTAYTVTIGSSDTGTGTAATAAIVLLDDPLATLAIYGRLLPQGGNGGTVVLAAGTLNLSSTGSGGSIVRSRISANYSSTANNPVTIVSEGATVDFNGGNLQNVDWIGPLELVTPTLTAAGAANTSNTPGSLVVLEPGGASTTSGLSGLVVQASDFTKGVVNLNGPGFSFVFADYQTFDNATVDLGSESATSVPGILVSESSGGNNGLGGSVLTLGPNLTINLQDDGLQSSGLLYGGINYSLPATTTDQLEVVNQGTVNAGEDPNSTNNGGTNPGSEFFIFGNWKGASTGTAPVFKNTGSVSVSGGTTLFQHAIFVNTGSVTISSTEAFSEFTVSGLSTSGNLQGNGTFYDQGGALTIGQNGEFLIASGSNGNGAFIGYGTVNGSLVDNGSLEASPTAYNGSATTGTLTITGNFSGSGTVQIDAGMTLAVSGRYAAGNSTTGTTFFDNISGSTPAESLSIGQSGGPGAVYSDAIAGFGFNDTLVLKGEGTTFTSIAFVYNSGNSGPGTLTLMGGEYTFSNFSVAANVSNPTGWFQVNDINGDAVISLACFAEGTRIATTRGNVAVEKLREGDVVITRDGIQPITWIGYRHLDLARHPRPELARPIRIARDAFARGVPARDLFVSPDHAVFWNGHLAEAKRLVNGATIAQAEPASVTYFHVELARHDIIFSDALTTETYLDTGNRGMFENAVEALVLHPDIATTRRRREDACAPMTFHGEPLAQIRQHLLDRARQLGFATTKDPDLHILADGKRIDAAKLSDRRLRFAIPKDAREIRLRSRTGIPAELLADASDDRILGAFVAALCITTAQGRHDVDLTALTEGFYPLEERGVWTNGDARLDISGPCLLEVTLAGTLPYRNQRRRAA